MRVIIVGCGKVGFGIAQSLSQERDVDITVVDNSADAIERARENLDVMFVRGNGLSENVLKQAGVIDADIVISVTHADETNILCCISAKFIGAKHTIARVRDPEYALELNKLWTELGIDMVINPEEQTAREISRLLRYPVADNVTTFVNGRVELVSFKLSEASGFFIGKSVAQAFHNKKAGVILALLERGDASLIPNGDTTFEADDILKILGRPSDIMHFFMIAGIKHEKINNLIIIGGGKITFYLTELLHRHTNKSQVKIIEKNKDKCNVLCETLQEKNPHCFVVHGDGMDEDFLLSEDIATAGAVISLTNMDEENILIMLYSMQLGIKKTVAKINHIHRSMIKSLRLGATVNPQTITSDQITSYARGLMASQSGDIISSHTISQDGGASAIEFTIFALTKCLDIKLKDLKIKKGILIVCIMRGGKIIIPTGDSLILMGDRVIIVSKIAGICMIDDILS